MRAMIPVSRLSFALQNKIFPRFFVVIGLRFAGVEDGEHYIGTLHEKIMNFASAVCRGLKMHLIQPKIRPRRCDVCCWNLTLPDVPFRLCLF